MLVLLFVILLSVLGANGLISSRLTHRASAGISIIDGGDGDYSIARSCYSHGQFLTNSALYAKKKVKKQTLDSCPPGCKVFLGNVPFHTTEQEIVEMVEDILGSNLITSVNIPRGKKTNRPFGYLFIDFKDPDVAQDFVDEVDGMIFEDRMLNGNIKDNTTPPSQASLDRKMFVLDRSVYLNNLDYSLNEEEIYNMCEDILGYDLVDRIKLAYDKRTGRPRGFGHVEFRDPETVERALVELDGLEVLDRPLEVTRLTMPGKASETIEERDARRAAEREAQQKEKYEKINRDDSEFYGSSDEEGGTPGGRGEGGDGDEDDVHNQEKESMEDIFADVMMDLPVEGEEDNAEESAGEVAEEELELSFASGDPLRG